MQIWKRKTKFKKLNRDQKIIEITSILEAYRNNPDLGADSIFAMDPEAFTAAIVTELIETPATIEESALIIAGMTILWCGNRWLEDNKANHNKESDNHGS